MNRLLLLACVAVLLTPGVAAAAPGDFVTITGTVQSERDGVLVVRADDGATYFADLRGATRGRPFRIGDRVSIAGYEGRRPDEINVATLDAAAGPGAVPSGDAVVIIDGWALPRSHIYQAQDDRGVYHDVRLPDVPATIARGKEVYDRTANAWVNHPTAYASTGGRNPAYTVAAVGASGDVVVIDGWRLPRTHLYQAQDDNGVYHDVRLRDIPMTIARGKEVYDRTASAWVNHPTAYASTGGRNPAYTVAMPRVSDDVVVIDGWRLPRTHLYQAQDDNGVYHDVHLRDVPATIARGKEVYDRSANAWVNHPTAYASTGGRNPAYTIPWR
jgi:hypothetical protein